MMQTPSNLQFIRNGAIVYEICNSPIRSVMWKLTSKCNQECKYCYGSFGGSSYRLDSSKTTDLNTDIIISTIDDIAAVGIKRIYYCGGEPLLRSDFWHIINYTQNKNIESYALSNLSVLPKDFADNFIKSNISSFSFSLDSLDAKYNNWARSNTSILLNNVEKLLNIKSVNNLSTEIGVYAVITRKNTQSVLSLYDWAISNNIDYITFQIVHLPLSHNLYKELTIVPGTKEAEEVLTALNFIKSKNNGKIRLPGDALLDLTNFRLRDDSGYKINNCFCQRDGVFLFIDSFGVVRRCACAPVKSLGNIVENSIPDLINKSAGKGNSCCEYFSTDCIATYETVFPRGV